MHTHANAAPSVGRYGSPAKSAAKERDRLRIELEQEHRHRQMAEESSSQLQAMLSQVHAQSQSHAQRGAMHAVDLERSRMEAVAAQTNAAVVASAQVRVCPRVRRVRQGVRERDRRLRARAHAHESGAQSDHDVSRNPNAPCALIHAPSLSTARAQSVTRRATRARAALPLQVHAAAAAADGRCAPTRGRCPIAMPRSQFGPQFGPRHVPPPFRVPPAKGRSSSTGRSCSTPRSASTQRPEARSASVERGGPRISRAEPPPPASPWVTQAAAWHGGVATPCTGLQGGGSYGPMPPYASGSSRMR